MGTLHPEMQAILDWRQAMGVPGFAEGSPEEARRIFAEAQATLPRDRGASVAAIRDAAIAGSGGDIRVRHYLPQGAIAGRLLYFHGGGWVFGTLDAFDPVCRELAATAGVEVVSVDYRLAPEHSYPAAIDDAWAALRQYAEPGLPLLVAGDSAGGNVAAALALRARDAGGPAITLQLLLYPALDSDFTRDSYRVYGTGEYLLSAADMAWFWDKYAPGAARLEPLAAPLRAPDVAGLPETILVLAGCDPLHDEGFAYGQRLAAAGVKTRIHDHPDMAHGFFTLVDLITPANAAVRTVAAEIAARLATLA